MLELFDGFFHILSVIFLGITAIYFIICAISLTLGAFCGIYEKITRG